MNAVVTKEKVSEEKGRTYPGALSIRNTLQPDGCKGYLTSICQNPRLTMSLGERKEEFSRKSKERQQTRSPRPSMWKTARIPQSPIPPQVEARDPREAARPPQAEAKGLPAAGSSKQGTRGSALALTSAPTATRQVTLRLPVRDAQDVILTAMMQRLAPGSISVSPSAAKTFVETAAPLTRTP